MSNYKHGDWYVKPANKAEAKEIIERAVASGAYNKYEYVGDSEITYGVFSGLVACDQSDGKAYTMSDIRRLFPLPGERADTANWCHTGAEVEVRMNGKWYPATICGQHGDYIIARAYGYWYDEYTDEDVRPLRSDRERWVEEVLKLDCCPTEGMLSRSDFTGAIYDALKSGAIKAPEVE
jgi:hypothetical protein